MREVKRAVITGSTGGIGAALAERLVAEGWRLVLVNRNAAKAEAQRAALTQAHKGAEITLVQADLMDTAQIRRAIETILADYPRIDALWNNSGILTSKRVQSAQGHESNYAVHVLAPYLLIEGLRPALARPNGARSIIVNTTSSAQNAAKALDVETLSNPPEIGGLTGAYATSKLALTTLGSALAEELERDGTLLRSICPGPVITPMTKTSDGMPWLLRPLVPFLFAKPEKQAAKMIRAAQPDALGGRTGIYISNGKEKSVPKLASDPEIQRRLLEKLAQDAA